MKRYISSLLVFVLLFSLFSPIIEATENSMSEDIYNEENYIQTSENVVATIPDNSDSLRSDLGVDSLIADIKSFNTFSLKKSRTNTVEIDVSSLDSSNLDVLHFIENVDAITEEMGIVDISDYSEDSKSVLTNAISAYQEKYNSDKECVVVETFENLPVENGSISFNVNSFSIFAIGEFDINTYEFYVDGNLYNTQVLIGNDDGEDILISPETPYKDDNEFLGWQIEGETDYIDFGTVSVNPSKNIIKVNAVFDEVSYVYFYYEAKENADILETLSGQPGDIIYTEHIDYPLSLDKHIVSWHTDIECTSPDVTEVVLTDEDIVLYPKVEKGHWVTFYTEGGSYIDPMFYGKDEIIIEPADPIREGYSFTGWYDEDGNKFEFNGQIVTESIKLKAEYEAENVNYTVQIVMQNPNKPDKYDPVLNGMFTLSGLCGATINATDISMDKINSVISGLGNTNYFKANLKYFYYSDTSNATENVELESDGSSVLYIYYDRYMTELNYYFSYTDEEPWKVQTGLYDADMPSSYWLIPTEEEYSNFGNWENSLNLLPAWTGQFDYSFKFDSTRNIYYFNVYATKGAENSFHFYSYVQAINPDGTVPDVGVDITNTPNKPHLNYYNPNYPGNEGKQTLIDNWSNIDFGTASNNEITNNGVWLLYESQDLPFIANMEYLTMFYDVEWYNGFTAVAVGFDLYHKVSGKLEAWSVDDYSTGKTWQSYITYLDSNRNETGVIEGSTYKETDSSNFYYLESDKWYAIDTPFKISKFYGNGYLRLIRNQFNLQFIMDDEKIADYDVYFETDLGIDKFTSVSENLEAPDGYIFGGWFTSPTLTEDTRFNLETNIMPAKDMILYGKWEPIKVELDVHVTIDGVDEIIEGFNAFTVRYGNIVNKEQVDELKTSVNIPNGAIWYGWYEKVDVGGGKELLVPFNFDKQLVQDVILYPFYSYMTPINVNYDLNGGTGTAPVDDFNYALGRGAVVLDNKNVVAPEGKVFVCWNTEPDGSGKSYYPADIALINNDGMSLYAIYENDIGTEKVDLTYVNTITNEEKFYEYDKSEQVEIKDKGIFSILTSLKYIFKGWNTKSDGTGTFYNSSDKVYLTEKGNKLYTIVEEDPNYKLVINYIDANNSQEVQFEYLGENSATVKDESIFSNIDDKYIFKGWSTEPNGGGTIYQSGEIITQIGEVELYAIWEEKIVITYINTLTSEEVEEKYIEGDSIKVKDKTIFVNPVESKYYFKEWNTESDGMGDVYNPNSSLDSSITLYAIWLEERIITYVNPLNSEEKVFKYTPFEMIVVKNLSIFENSVDSKYIFKGWNTESNYSGTSYNYLDILRATTTLYAVWEEEVTSLPSRPSNPVSTKYTYTIYYKDIDGKDISEKVVGKGEVNEIIKAESKDINGYVCKDSEKSLKITRNSESNIIIFEYIKEYQIPNHKYLDYTLNHKLYIVGYEDGTVRPENNITRAESVTIFYRLLKDDIQKQYRTNSNKFTDVDENAWFNTSVSTLTNMGIIGGYSDNTFRPNQYITRAEFITLMVGFFDADTKVANNKFIDVFENDWFYKSVIVGVEKGFIAGYPDGTFKPNQYITRAEACKIVNQVLDRKPTKLGLYENLINWPDLDESAWYYLDIIEATHSHIADYNYFDNNLENWKN